MRKILSLNSFYSKISKHILLAEAYTEISELSFIIKSCRLKPYNYVFGDRNHNVTLHRLWFDEYRNSLSIVNKRLRLTYNNLLFRDNNIISTDLYYGLPIKNIIKMSKMAYICVGKDEDLLKDCFIISLLGIDDYLRTYLYMYDECVQVSPLLLGIDIIKLIYNDIGVRHYVELNNIPIPCVAAQSWITYLPMSDDLLQQIGKQHSIVEALFFKKE